MNIDFSFLTSIDFAKKDNLLFLAVFLFLVAAIFFIAIEVLVGLIKIIKKIFIKLFPPKFKKNIGNDPKYIKAEGSIELKAEKDEEKSMEPITTPKMKIVGAGVSMSSIGAEKTEGETQNTLKSYKDKEKKDISEGLEKLKAEGSKDLKKEDTLESKMPSRTKNVNEGHNEIELPTSSKLHGQLFLNTKKQIEAAQKTLKQGATEKVLNTHDAGNNKISHEKKADSSMPGAVKEQEVKGGIMFQGKPEISRKELAYELKKNPKIWQINRDLRLNLTRTERADLVKEVFPEAYGRNISKRDLKHSVRKLSKKMLGTADPAEHAKLKKELKFFKKIGGI